MCITVCKPLCCPSQLQPLDPPRPAQVIHRPFQECAERENIIFHDACADVVVEGLLSRAIEVLGDHQAVFEGLLVDVVEDVEERLLGEQDHVWKMMQSKMKREREEIKEIRGKSCVQMMKGEVVKEAGTAGKERESL